MMILPIDIEERIKVFSSLPYILSEDIIDYLANNRYIYHLCDKPIVIIHHIISDIGRIPYIRAKTHVVEPFPINTNIDRPFILYEAKDNYLRGFFTPDHENETLYRDYKNQYAIYREKRINKILDE